MSAPRVCILTAGIGSRLNQRTKYFNKALLKVGDVAVITHQIRLFPAETTFIIGLGYMGNVVRQYLAAAHPVTKFIFVEIDKYSVPGSGPGYAMQKCRKHLQQPFYFLACDTLVPDFKYSEPHPENMAGYAHVKHGTQQNYCILYMPCGCCVLDYFDKKECNEHATEAYNGFSRVENYGAFWRALDELKPSANGEIQIAPALLHRSLDPTPVQMQWLDVGTEEGLLKAREFYPGLQNLDKDNEEIYFVDGKVIKYFYDENLAQARIERAKILNNFVPELTYRCKNVYAYDFIQGADLFHVKEPHKHLENLLYYMHKAFWVPGPSKDKRFLAQCMEFYREKSYGRVKDFTTKANIGCRCIINNVATDSAEYILDHIDWKSLAHGGYRTRIHGDFQLSNVVINKSGQFTLIDWRQDFAGDLHWGDMYYDLAKLNACFVMPHDSVKNGLYEYKESKGEVLVSIEMSEEIQRCQEVLKNWHDANGFDWDRTVFLTYLALLNMAPLHESPLDKWLHYTARRGLAAQGQKFFTQDDQHA